MGFDWNSLTTSSPSWVWFPLALFAVHTAALWGAHAVFQWMHRRGWLARYRVAGGEAPPAELMRKSYLRVALNGLSFLLVSLAVWYALTLRGVDWGAPPPGWLTVGWQLIAFVFITDTAFYWMHRLLHRPWWFGQIHRQHHEFRFVRGISAEYSHTLEDLGNVLTSFLGPVLLGAHPATVLIWFFLRMLETVDAHSGYALPTSPWGSRHAYHHQFNRGNYGGFLSVWDRLLGTDRDWRAWKASQPR